jgi:hypothetical protein
MAITSIDRIIFAKLRESKLFPAQPSLLELGEAEWYGDIPIEVLSDDIEDLVPDKEARERLQQRVVDILSGDSPYKSWDIAKVFYHVYTDCRKITAIDLHGTPAAHRLDLNQPAALGEQFDIVFDTGTAEHVFNVYQFFKTTHEATRSGGLMLHTMPFRGWLEHGFYSFNPTFFWDLALANSYTMLILAYTELSPPKLVQLRNRQQIVEMERNKQFGDNALLYAVMKKPDAEVEFSVPMQATYAPGNGG